MVRSYDSEIRREHATTTRREVIDAAVAVFGELGWAGTTMTAVAERAGVSVETVYRAIPGGKAALLAAAVQAALAGGAQRSEVRIDERPGIRRIIDARSPRAALQAYASVVPSTWKRVGPLLAALASAAPDEHLTRLANQLDEQRLAGMRRFARQLDEARALRTDVSTDRAADVLWTVCSYANYDALTRASGWPVADYVEWVTRTLSAELLAPADERRTWHHLAIPVADLARSQRWYESVLGATLERTTDTAAERAAGRVPQAWLDVAGTTVNLAEHGTLPRDPERHFLHVAITDDAHLGLSGWLAHLAAHATQPIGPYAHGGLSFISLYFDDPDGFRWEVILEYPDPDAALAAARAAGGAIGSPVREYPWPSDG